jgi:hypothetical protein
VSECDREVSILRTPWPTKGCCAIGKKIYMNALVLFILYCVIVLATFGLYIYVIRKFRTIGIIGLSTPPAGPFVRVCNIVISV